MDNMVVTMWYGIRG